MSKLEIHQFPCHADNYGALVRFGDAGECASIDAPDDAAVEAALATTGWTLSHILVTHWHADHVQGIEPLKEKHGCRVIGPGGSKIPGLDEAVGHGDRFELGAHPVAVIATPGHTMDMINFHFVDDDVVFTGDTLFAMGCGRLFEGDAKTMWRSLERLMALPPQTKVYCGHEYTLANARFAVTVDPDNGELADRLSEVEKLREAGEPTLPTTIGRELATNPFLRVADPAIRAQLGLESAADWEVFAEVRKRKDNA